jgi:Cu+-exporting ATPase
MMSGWIGCATGGIWPWPSRITIIRTAPMRGVGKCQRARSGPARCIRRSSSPGPGSCPICGMALGTDDADALDGPSPEYADMKRRFVIGLILACRWFALEMGGHLTGCRLIWPATSPNWVQMVLATPVVLWAGWPFLRARLGLAQNAHLNMFTLIAMGTGVAWIYSMVATLAPGIVPGGVSHNGRLGRGLFRGGGGHHRAGPARAGARTARPGNDQRRDPRAARPVAQARPRVRADGSDEEITLDQVAVGDTLRVRPARRFRSMAR